MTEVQTIIAKLEASGVDTSGVYTPLDLNELLDSLGWI